MEIVLRHKLEFHIKYLEKLRTVFRKFDPQNHGTISSGNLKKLLKEMKLPTNSKASEAFAKTGAEKLEKVTFGDLVETLASLHVEKGAVLISLLQFYNEN